MFEAKAEAEAKALRPRLRSRPKFWPGGHFGLEDLTSLGPGRCSPPPESGKSIIFSAEAKFFGQKPTANSKK